MKSTAGLCLAGLILGAFAVDRPAAAAGITPHRAVYELSLNRGSTGGNVADVSGVMEFEWADACDGWAVSHRSAMTFLYHTGDELEFGWSHVSWEAKDGSRFRFFMRKVENGQETEALRGEAQLDAPGAGGTAKYSAPERRSVSLPPGTMFPTAHSIEMLQRAEKGEQFHWATVFDGSDEEGLHGVNAVIGRRLEPEKASSRSPLLSAAPSWRIRIAFYGQEPPALVPEHEQSWRVHANGVVEEMVLDYGDFSVEGKLVRIEALPPPPC